MKTDIVILGGSYAGISAMLTLQKNSQLNITLIDQHPYHFLQTQGYELISGDITFEDVIISLPALCANYANVLFRHRTILSIDKKKKIVLLNNGEQKYDIVIIALGRVTKHLNTDSHIHNYSSGAKSLRGALKLHQFFQTELYKRLESDKKSKESFNIVVGGAGLSGVEIAAGMQYFFNRYYKSNALSCANLHIHLIASRERVLYGMHTSIIDLATKRLKKLRVHVHLKNRIEAINTHQVVLSDGTTIAFDFMISAGGTTIAPCLNILDLKKTRKGQFVVDNYLRAEGQSDIYMAGDVASLCDNKGNSLAPTAQTAIQSGRIVADNILRDVQGKKPKKANMKIKGLAIALGGKYAIIEFGRFHIDGYFAYLIKKLIEKIYKWRLWWLSYRGFKKIKSCEI